MRNSRLTFSALAIGAMSPDFSYILGLAGPRFEAHSLRGMVTFSLPAALVVWIIFEFYAKEPWSRVFPWLRSRATKTSYISVLLSAALGILTHVVWDSVTHRSGWPVQNFSFLREGFELGPFGTRPLYHQLQHISSVIGLLALAGALITHLIRTRTPLIGSWSDFLMSVILACAIAFLFGLPLLVRGRQFFEIAAFESNVVQLAFRLLAAMAVTLVTFPIFLALRNRAS